MSGISAFLAVAAILSAIPVAGDSVRSPDLGVFNGTELTGEPPFRTAKHESGGLIQDRSNGLIQDHPQCCFHLMKASN